MTLLTALAADGRPRWLQPRARRLSRPRSLRAARRRRLHADGRRGDGAERPRDRRLLLSGALCDARRRRRHHRQRPAADRRRGGWRPVGALAMRFSAEEPLARTSLMILFTVGGMFLASATTLGSMASTAGFVLALAVTLFDIVPIPELMVRGALYLWEAVAVPMVAVIVVAAFGAPRAHVLLRRAAIARIEAAAALLRGEPDAPARGARAARPRGRQGARAAENRVAVLFRRRQSPRRAFSRCSTAPMRCWRRSPGAAPAPISAGARAQRSPRGSIGSRRRRRRCAPARRRATIRRVSRTPISWPRWSATPRRRSRRASSRAPAGRSREPFFHADAFDNPDHLRFGLKTALAAFVCYAIYTGLDWFGIHTAMVTCYFVALSSVGETVHKLTLRIVGCLIGAGLGVFAIVVLMPVMTDIGQLALMVGAVAFVAAWIAAGSPRISYMGWQIAFAFFLCTLNSFGPSFDLVGARDRVLGILLGNLVMTVVFTTVWPVGVQRAVGRSVAAASRALSRFADPAVGRDGRRRRALRRRDRRGAAGRRAARVRARRGGPRRSRPRRRRGRRGRAGAARRRARRRAARARRRGARRIPARSRAPRRNDVPPRGLRLAGRLRLPYRGRVRGRRFAMARRAGGGVGGGRGVRRRRAGRLRGGAGAAGRRRPADRRRHPAARRGGVAACDGSSARSPTSAAARPRTLVVAAALAGCASQSESLAPASAETPYVPNVAESAPPPPGVADYGLPPQADMPIDLPKPAVDPRRAYTLPELVDIAESSNPVTRAAWERARQAALAVGVAESDLSAAPQRPGPRRLPICVAGQSERRDFLLGAAGRRHLAARRAGGRVARDLRAGDRSRAGRHAAMAAVRFRRPRGGDRERAAIVDRFRRRLQRRAPEADLRGRLDLLPVHRGARAGRDRDRDARQREGSSMRRRNRAMSAASPRRSRSPRPSSRSRRLSSASSSRRGSSATAITRC